MPHINARIQWHFVFSFNYSCIYSYMILGFARTLRFISLQYEYETPGVILTAMRSIVLLKNEIDGNWNENHLILKSELWNCNKIFYWVKKKVCNKKNSFWNSPSLIISNCWHGNKNKSNTYDLVEQNREDETKTWSFRVKVCVSRTRKQFIRNQWTTDELRMNAFHLK